MTSTLRSNLSRQTSSTIEQAMKRAQSAERSLATTSLAPTIRAALRQACTHLIGLGVGFKEVISVDSLVNTS